MNKNNCYIGIIWPRAVRNREENQLTDFEEFPALAPFFSFFFVMDEIENFGMSLFLTPCPQFQAWHTAKIQVYYNETVRIFRRRRIKTPSPPSKRLSRKGVSETPLPGADRKCQGPTSSPSPPTPSLGRNS